MSRELRNRSFNNTLPEVIVQLPAEEFVYAILVDVDTYTTEADDRAAVEELRTLSEP